MIRKTPSSAPTLTVTADGAEVVSPSLSVTENVSFATTRSRLS